MECRSSFSPPTRGLFLANIDPKLNCSAKKMFEAVPALEITSEIDAEPLLRLEKPLPETPVSEESFSAMEERFSAKPCQDIQLPTKESSEAVVLATNKIENGPKPLLEPGRALPETPAFESLGSLASALAGWPPPTPKPATLSEPSRLVTDIQARKESDTQEPMSRRANPLPASPSRAGIRNFSRPLGTPRAPLQSLQPPPNFFRSPRLVGSSRYSHGGFVSPTTGDVATVPYRLSSVNGARLKGKHKDEIRCQKREDAGYQGKDRSCSQCRLM